MPSVGALVLGAGARGPTGATGTSGAFTEPTSLINGRTATSSWVPVLPLRANTVDVNEATFSGGITMGSRNSSSVTNTTQHIDLWAGLYGLNYYNGPLLCSQGNIDFHCVGFGGWSVSFRTGPSNRELHFSTDGWRFHHNTSNKDFIYYTYNSSPWFGYQGDYGRFVVWGQWQSIGTVNLASSSYGMMFDNIVAVGWKFLWSGGNIWARLNNGSVDWQLVNACDERLKEDIAPSTHDCLATIRKIRLFQYRWKEHKRPGWPKPAKPDAPLIPVGFVAQRLEEDFPQGIPQIPPPPKRAPGWHNRIKTSDLNSMMALLCGAVQELDSEITRQEQLAANLTRDAA